MEFLLREAQLYRLLSQLFGQERIVPRMSVTAICGGNLPAGIPQSWGLWAKQTKCLFTIVDGEDNPKLVVQFFSGFQEAIDPQEEEEQRYLPEIFLAAGIQYATISEREFEDILDPGVAFSLCDCLQAQIEAAVSVGIDEELER